MVLTRATARDVFATLFLAGVLFVFAGLSRVFAQATGHSGTPLFAGLWLSTYALGALALGPHRRLSLSTALLVGAVALSQMANLDAASRAAYGIMFLLTAYLAAGLSASLGPAAFLRRLERIAWIAALVSLAGYAVALPGFALDDGLGRLNWLGLEPLAGVFSHKVNAGIALAVGLIVTLFLRERHWRWRLGTYLLALSLTDSAGAILFGAAALVWGGLASAGARRLGRGAVLLSLDTLVLAGILLALFLPQLDTLMGRDVENLTGRIPIWLSGLEAWRAQPVFGLGYENVVTHPAFLARLAVHTPMGYHPPHLHNAYLQALVATGIVGAVAFGMFVLAASWKALTLLARSPSPVTGAYASLSFFLLCIAMTEVPFAHNSLGLALFAFLLSSRPRDFARNAQPRDEPVSTRQRNFGASTR